VWSKQVIWGNHRIKGGVIRPNANAFQLGTTWGAFADRDGDNIVWGTLGGDNLVWGTVDQLSADNLVWGTVLNSNGDNLVWGTMRDGDNLVWGTLSGDDNIVWGTDCGGKDCDNLVWGTAITAQNLVWGTSLSADNLVWGTASAGDNLVWGTSGDVDNLVWGSSAEDDNLTWGNSGEDTRCSTIRLRSRQNFDQTVFESLFGEPLVTVAGRAEHHHAPLTRRSTGHLGGSLIMEKMPYRDGRAHWACTLPGGTVGDDNRRTGGRRCRC
jgi:hypothetical protein